MFFVTGFVLVCCGLRQFVWFGFLVGWFNFTALNVKVKKLSLAKAESQALHILQLRTDLKVQFGMWRSPCSI